MAYSEFEELSKQQECELGLANMSIDEIEKLHWAQIQTEKKYSISNSISLFGNDVMLWNLNKFTKIESNLHLTKPHYESNVSVK